MPGERLTADVQAWAARIAENGAERLEMPQVGYFLRSYTRLFNGDGPLSDSDAWEVLPDAAKDSLTHVAEKSLNLLRVAAENDFTPFDITKLLETDSDPDLEEYGVIYNVIYSASSSLEMVRDPDPAIRAYTEENDLLDLSGQYDPDRDGPIRTSWGTALVTRDAALDLLMTASNEFGTVFGGCEIVLPDSVRRRDSVVGGIAQLVGSEYQHPEYIQPDFHNEVW